MRASETIEPNDRAARIGGNNVSLVVDVAIMSVAMPSLSYKYST